MDVMYGTPDSMLRVNGVEVESVESAQVILDRSAPIARAEIRLDRDVPAAVTVENGDQVELALGYREGELLPVFKGKVSCTEPGRLVGLTCLDRMQGLAETRIRQAFRNVTLHDVATWCLEHAGVNQYSLGSLNTQRRHHFVCSGEPALDILRRAAETWGLEWDLYMDAQGVMFFMPWLETPEASADPVLDLEYGVNLTHLQPVTGGVGTAETFLAPWVRQGHRLNLRDAHLWGAAVTVRAERVTHSLDRRAGRTRIEWTLLS